MGTRSVITFKENDKPICAVYQQYDGYTDGKGQELKDFLRSKQFVNGIGQDNNVFNGAGCCIAQFISTFKTEAGNLYMVEIGSKEEYNYSVNFKYGDNYIVSEIEISVDSKEGKDFNEVMIM